MAEDAESDEPSVAD